MLNDLLAAFGSTLFAKILKKLIAKGWTERGNEVAKERRSKVTCKEISRSQRHQHFIMEIPKKYKDN